MFNGPKVAWHLWPTEAASKVPVVKTVHSGLNIGRPVAQVSASNEPMSSGRGAGKSIRHAPGVPRLQPRRPTVTRLLLATDSEVVARVGGIVFRAVDPESASRQGCSFGSGLHITAVVTKKLDRSVVGLAHNQ